MTTKEIFRNAQHLGLPVDSAVKSGDIVTFSNIGGVAQTDYDARDGKATIWFDGGYEFGPYTGFSVGNATYAIGDAIYAHAVGGGAAEREAAASSSMRTARCESSPAPTRASKRSARKCTSRRAKSSCGACSSTS